MGTSDDADCRYNSTQHYNTNTATLEYILCVNSRSSHHHGFSVVSATQTPASIGCRPGFPCCTVVTKSYHPRYSFVPVSYAPSCDVSLFRVDSLSMSLTSYLPSESVRTGPFPSCFRSDSTVPAKKIQVFTIGRQAASNRFLRMSSSAFPVTDGRWGRGSTEEGTAAYHHAAVQYNARPRSKTRRTSQSHRSGGADESGKASRSLQQGIVTACTVQYNSVV